MNDEYISKEDIIRQICLTTGCSYYGPVVRTIIDFPAADVQPVKRGRWSECYTDTHHYSGICSVCGKASIKSLAESLYAFCPKCGARMDGDTE